MRCLQHQGVIIQFSNSKSLCFSGVSDTFLTNTYLVLVLGFYFYFVI